MTITHQQAMEAWQRLASGVWRADADDLLLSTYFVEQMAKDRAAVPPKGHIIDDMGTVRTVPVWLNIYVACPPAEAARTNGANQ